MPLSLTFLAKMMVVTCVSRLAYPIALLHTQTRTCSGRSRLTLTRLLRTASACGACHRAAPGRRRSGEAAGVGAKGEDVRVGRAQVEG